MLVFFFESARDHSTKNIQTDALAPLDNVELYLVERLRALRRAAQKIRAASQDEDLQKTVIYAVVHDIDIYAAMLLDRADLVPQHNRTADGFVDSRIQLVFKTALRAANSASAHQAQYLENRRPDIEREIAQAFKTLRATPLIGLLTHVLSGKKGMPTSAQAGSSAQDFRDWAVATHGDFLHAHGILFDGRRRRRNLGSTGPQQTERTIGRPPVTGSRIRPLVTQWLAADSTLTTSELLRRAKSHGYGGGRSAFYQLVARLRPETRRNI